MPPATMRIISGTLKGLSLKTPAGIRPTQGKVRKAVLDILGARVRDARCLELFAGSGAVGLEMLSGGAAQVTCVEQDPACVKVLRQNASAAAERLGQAASNGTAHCPAPIRILQADAMAAVKRLHDEGVKFDVVFIDPPYYQGLIADCLQIIDCHAIVAENFALVVQGYWKDSYPKIFKQFRQQKVARYGDTVLAWYAA